MKDDVSPGFADFLSKQEVAERQVEQNVFEQLKGSEDFLGSGHLILNSSGDDLVIVDPRLQVREYRWCRCEVDVLSCTELVYSNAGGL